MGLLLYVLSNPSPERKLLNLAIQYQQQLKLVLQSTPGWEQDRIATRASLAALQGLANLIGASLNLDRTPASISIQVELPIAPPLKAVAPLSKGQSSLKVLILDDEEKVATSLKRVLNQHQVTLATTVAKALAVLEQVRVDVIICDVILGDETAIDLYTAVQKRWLELQSRMVFMSGAAYTTQARAFLESVPNPRFDKPFQIQAVRDLIGSFSPLDT
jgi:CheY-like chemotaxis protein